MTFGEKLKLLRYEKGLTQDDLGYLFNVTKSCISCYESGSRKPSIDMLIQVASYFRVSIDYLINMDSVSKDVKFTKKDIEFLNMLKDDPITYKQIMKHTSRSIKKIRKVLREEK